jgi:NAD-dependent dihydropyrimidine dehydrogenase PreA subunit
MNQIKFDFDKCTKCKLCTKICFVDVIRWDDKESAPIAKYPEDCIECNICEIYCPKEAINVVIDYDKPFPEPYIGRF